MTPVENGSTCSGAMPSRAASAAQLRRARQTVFAGAGVGVAGVDQHGADAAVHSSVRQVLAAQLHRRRAEAVAREDAGHCRAFFEREDDEIAPPGLAHAGHRAADAQAGDRMQRSGIGDREVDGHGGRLGRWQRMRARAARGQAVRQAVRQAGRRTARRSGAQASLPWQCLYFLPLPQGQGSLRPTFGTAAATVLGSASWLTLPSSFGCW